MVSYHTPKVYRSSFGCCICRAKSSSSRFTDSSRYESDFLECFKLEEPRYGEICNACVLLIKRWKKLPVGSKRNWHHVVDARARPRVKSTVTQPDTGACSTSNSPTMDKSCSQRMKKLGYHQNGAREWALSELEDQGFAEDRFSEASGGTSMPSSRAPSPSYPSEDDGAPSMNKRGSSRRKQMQPSRLKYKSYGDFINYNYWKKEKVCCGYVFKGACGEVLIDPRLFKPCCPSEVGTRIPSPEMADATGGSMGGLSDGSFYDDEGLESLDEEASSVDAFYGPSSSSSEERQKTSFLSQLAAAFIT